MKRSYVIVGIVVILASSYLIEYYTNRRFPTQELTITELASLPIGETQTYDYYRMMEKVGTYRYSITGGPSGLYTMVSNTNVSSEDKILTLEGSYVFDDKFNPVNYELYVDQGGETTQITVEFSEGKVTSSVLIGEETVVVSEDFPKGAYLAENNMPGFWEVLLLSTKLERSVRYKANVYVPQGGGVFELDFFVNNNLKTIRIGNQQLECLVISESLLELSFYIYDNQLVQIRNEPQETVLEKRIA